MSWAPLNGSHLEIILSSGNSLPFELSVCDCGSFAFVDSTVNRLSKRIIYHACAAETKRCSSISRPSSDGANEPSGQDTQRSIVRPC